MSDSPQHARGPEPGGAPPGHAGDAATATAATAWTELCPYLLDITASWRATFPTSDHRCTAVVPPGPLTAETQRSLCLGPAHVDCPVYQRARQARVASLGPPADVPRRRPVPLTAPVIIERPSGLALVLARARESLPQVGLVLVITLAVAALVLARFISP
jgi:hypothetical protein